MKARPAKSCTSCGERYDADVLFCPRDGTPLASSRNPTIPGAANDPYLGLALAGQIQIKHLIGIGSMGRVYRAFQAGIDRDVAVKILHRELSANAELVSRFHREAKVASRLVHPNVVQVLMTGCVQAGSDVRIGGELYLVMEHLDGMSLLSALAAAGTDGEGAALPLARALHIALQICDAVGEAHAQNITHRDLKPENVMLVRRGEDPDYVKVLDFGIARMDWGDKSMATQAGLIFGTAKYISPEGAEGTPVGPAADVYSIATILYQCLAGRTPFEGDSPVALLVQHTHAPPPELRSIARASYVPPAIAQVVMQNLAKKPGERAATARAFGRDLVAAARAAGLDPDEIVSSSTLLRQSGNVVKLASKERTKALELSPELAARIGGVAARPDPTPLPVRASAPPAAPSGAGEVAADAAPHSSRPSAPPSRRHGAARHSRPAPSPRGARPSARPAPPAASEAAPSDLDFNDAAWPEGQEPPRDAPASLPSQSTLQGTESGAESRPLRRGPRARIVRAAAIAACALAAAGAIVVAGRHFGAISSSASADTIEAHLEEARDCMRRHAWDAPPQHNVKEITAAAVAKWPGDGRVAELRREAAERLVSDALGRKYAGDTGEALRLGRLAMELNPSLTTAQHLVAELDHGRAPEIAPAASGAPDERPARPGHPRKGPGAAPSASASATPAAVPSASASAGPAAGATAGPGAVLPPPPPPLPEGHAPPSPTPASTGPWL